MNIEVGKFYKTRDGRKARIYALDGGPEGSRIHGAILNSYAWITEVWTSDGKAFSSAREHCDDLIAPWVDKTN